MPDIKEMRQKDIAELKTELETTKKELFRLRCRQVTDVVQNHTVIRKLRKNIACLNTIIKEKQNTSSKTNNR
jgi:large subunit ribosomal protein L29